MQGKRSYNHNKHTRIEKAALNIEGTNCMRARERMWKQLYAYTRRIMNVFALLKCCSKTQETNEKEEDVTCHM